MTNSRMAERSKVDGRSRTMAHSYAEIFYLLYLTVVLTFNGAFVDARSVNVTFNDARCADGRSVCPTDPLLFNCTVTGVTSDRITIKVDNRKGEINLNDDNTISGSDGGLPDGVTVQSHSVEVNHNLGDYTLMLSIANASLLDGNMIICDARTTTVDDGVAGCPVAGDPDPPLRLPHKVSSKPVPSALIRWGLPPNNGGRGISITKYRIMSRSIELCLNEIVCDMVYNITGLKHDITYTVEVTAINSCGLESQPTSVTFNISQILPPVGDDLDDGDRAALVGVSAGGFINVVVPILIVLWCVWYVRSRNQRKKLDGLDGQEMIEMVSSSLESPSPTPKEPPPPSSTYQDPPTTPHPQTGEIYTGIDLKKKKRKSSEEAGHEYRDPSTVQHQEAPSGDMYAEVQKGKKGKEDTAALHSKADRHEEKLTYAQLDVSPRPHPSPVTPPPEHPTYATLQTQM